MNIKTLLFLSGIAAQPLTPIHKNTYSARFIYSLKNNSEFRHAVYHSLAIALCSSICIASISCICKYNKESPKLAFLASLLAASTGFVSYKWSPPLTKIYYHIKPSPKKC